MEFPIGYETIFADYFKWTPPNVKLNCYNKILIQWNNLFQKNIRIIDYFIKRNITRVAIWGRGDLCKCILKELEGAIEVMCIVESNPTGAQYENISVVEPDNVPDNVQVIVVIPVYDMVNIRKKKGENSVYKLVGIDEILESDYE